MNDFILTWHRAGNSLHRLNDLESIASICNESSSVTQVSLSAEADIKWLDDGSVVIPYIHHGLTGLWLAQSQRDLVEKVSSGKALMLSEVLERTAGKGFGFDFELKNGVGSPERAVQVIGELCEHNRIEFRCISSSYDLCRAARSVLGKRCQVGFLSLLAPINSLRLNRGRILHFPKRNLRQNISFGLYPTFEKMIAIDYLITSAGPLGPGFKVAVDLLGRAGKGFCPGPVRSCRDIARAIEEGACGAFVYMSAANFQETVEELTNE